MTDQLLNKEIANHLFHVCRESAQIYQVAADDAHSKGLSAKFSMFAQQRSVFAVQWAQRLDELGAEPSQDWTVKASGMIYQLWMRLKSSTADRDELSILQDCEQVEDAILEEYHQTLEKPMSDSLRELAQQQVEDIKHIRHHIQIYSETVE